MKKDLKNQKILIIDDIPDNITLICGILDYNGFDTYVAHSGQRALDIIRFSTPDLILLDIMMPEMDGFELCSILKSNPKTKDIPVIFVTARNDMDTIAKGFEMGAVDYIVKPVQAVELIKRIGNHLKLKQSQEELKLSNKNLEQLVHKRTVKLRKEIDERKNAEIILKENEEKFRYLFNNNNDGILITSLEGKIIECNDTFLKMLCLKNETIMQYDLKDIFVEKFKLNDDELYHNLINSDNLITELSFDNCEFHKVSFQIKSKKIQFGKKEALLIFIHEITQQKENERQIFKTIIETEEKERKRFARDIHDGLGSLLSSANMYVNLLHEKEHEKERKEKILKTITELLSMAITSARNIGNNIKPHLLNNYGMEEALKSIFEKITQNSDITINFNYKLNSKLNEDKEVVLFRITNELITNTIKYAEANTIAVSLTELNNKITLTYTDDGKGFIVDEAMKKDDSSMGLQNILTRVKSIDGQCIINSELGKGCFIEVVVNI